MLTHDLVIDDADHGRVSPHGVHDIGADEAWVSVGTDHDTAAFAVEGIRRWWLTMGRALHPGATRLLVTADRGGSNGARVRLWKPELQRLADETGLEVAVCHLPPGTSKWSKVEHRLLGDHPELAGDAADQPRGDRGPHRGHHDADRPPGQERARHQRLPEGGDRPRLGHGDPARRPGRLPRRVGCVQKSGGRPQALSPTRTRRRQPVRVRFG